MFSPEAVLSVAWLPTEALVTTDRGPMSAERISFYLGLMSQAGEGWAPGLVIVWPWTAERYKVIDGRHRWLAHVMLGRPQVRCLIQAESTPQAPAHPPCIESGTS